MVPWLLGSERCLVEVPSTVLALYALSPAARLDVLAVKAIVCLQPISGYVIFMIAVHLWYTWYIYGTLGLPCSHYNATSLSRQSLRPGTWTCWQSDEPGNSRVPARKLCRLGSGLG